MKNTLTKENSDIQKALLIQEEYNKGKDFDDATKQKQIELIKSLNTYWFYIEEIVKLSFEDTEFNEFLRNHGCDYPNWLTRRDPFVKKFYKLRKLNQS